MKLQLMKKSLASMLVLSTSFFTPAALAQDSVVTLEEAIKASRVLANFRLRYEGADFDNGTESADALTYRARVGLETGAFLGTKFLVEFDHIEDLAGNFNDTINGNNIS